MILLSHPTGNANVRHAALGLARAGLLGEFCTSLNYRETPALRRLLPESLRLQLRRRSFPSELAPLTRAYPMRELVRLLAPRAGLRSLVRRETGPFSVDAVYHALDRRVAARVAQRKFTGVYAYEDGADATFRAARRTGLTTFYDLPIGYWRAARTILTEEAEREPEWASTLHGNQDSPAKTARKDEELALADVVLVASSFTLKTLDAAPDFRGRVVLIPYGAPAPVAPPPPRERNASARSSRLRVLYVGSLGQRKGLSYLFRAADQLAGAIDLTVIGAKPMTPCAPLDAALARIRWIPSAPHAQVLTEMAAHDVFVFPSLFEGFGLVLLEAMAMGLPLITTAHTAGPDLISDGVEGYIVPIRSTSAIVERLDFLRRNPATRMEMARAAQLRAQQFTWDHYESTLAACVQTTLAAR
ncbi:glycosyltransferase family 4 protein [Horticoccus luteus]|uniref:Glycosyltransferase family 4 protein n=1 Tax=Horticoccus luteus TaxID=2862869 RepID=A0A8F9TWF2_9BACT|nr:glycosyltransferase family 4 protein [Horticoccus luteus]QYM80340.1 glycosyltransferase family 4 protein [Horticoccus luteus]